MQGVIMTFMCTMYLDRSWFGGFALLGLTMLFTWHFVLKNFQELFMLP